MKTTRFETSRANRISCVTIRSVAPHRQTQDRVQHLLDEFRVEGGGHLVEEDELGIHRERTGNGDALLLAARKLARVMSSPAKPYACEPVLRDRARLWLVQATNLARPSITLPAAVRCGNRLKLWNTIPVIERWRDSSRSPKRWRRPFTILIPDDFPVEHDVAVLEFLEEVDASQQRRLARAARSDDRHHFAFLSVRSTP